MRSILLHLHHLDLLGETHEVVTDQVYGQSLNRMNFLDALHTFEVKSANTGASKNQQGQWHWRTLVQRGYT